MFECMNISLDEILNNKKKCSQNKNFQLFSSLRETTSNASVK